MPDFTDFVRWLRLRIPDPPTVWRYGIAVLAVFGATAVRLAFDPVLGVEAPHMPFNVAVIVASRFGGRGPGLVSIALSALCVDWFFLSPRHSLAVAAPEAKWGLLFLVTTGTLIALMVGSLRDLLLLRTRREEEVRVSQARLEFVLQTAKLGIWDFDLSGNSVQRSPQHDAIFGYSALLPEWTYEMFMDHVLPEDREDVRQKFWEAQAKHNTDVELECRIRRADGTVGWIWMSGKSHTAQDGRPLKLTGIVRDITARKNLEDDLRRSEELFRTLANAIPQLCGIADSGGGLFWVNQRWQEYTGLAPEESVGWGWLSALDPEASQAALESWRQSIAAEMPFESVFAVRGADGIVRPFLTRAVPLRDREGAVYRWFGTMTDISEQRKAENALRKAHSEELARAKELEAIMDAVPVAMFVSRDPEARNIIGNRSAYELLREAPGSNLSKSAAESERPTAFRLAKDGKELPPCELPVQKAAATGKAIYNFELELLFNDGSQGTILGNAVPFLDAEGRSRGSVGVFVDITDRKRNEERLRQVQKLESIGLLAGGIAHDFNNLLTVIIGNADCALRQYPSSDEIQHIISASERAAQLTGQLLAYAGKGQFASSAFDLNDLVSRSMQLLSASIPKRVSLAFHPSEQQLVIKADPTQIEQALLNLVINAAEAIPPGVDGRIEIATTECDVAPEVAGAHTPTFDVRAGQFVCLEVKDNGSGMDEATVARIFDPFFSTKFTGRGLGLAAVQGIVRSCRGFIQVQSASDGGSTFRIFLPLVERPATKIRSGRRLAAVRRRDPRHAAVLVVDDEEMVRKLACMALQSYGYQVLEARDGKDALEVLANSARPPSLVLLDLTMPALGGEELVPILNREYPSLPILVTSGYPEEDARKDFAPGSVAGFLQKPFTVAALTEKVNEILNSAGPSEEAPAAA